MDNPVFVSLPASAFGIFDIGLLEIFDGNPTVKAGLSFLFTLKGKSDFFEDKFIS